MARTTKAALEAQGKAAFTRALDSLGHKVAAAAVAGDLRVIVDGIEVPVELRAASVVDHGSVTRLSGTKPKAGIQRVVVGDLITQTARDDLTSAGCSWLDRRGHLVLRAKGVHIDADVPPDLRSPSGPPPPVLSGSAAISWAAALLMSPEDPPPMRAVGRRVALSHTAIANAARRLRSASLTRSDGRPLVPELFWAVAEVWQPRQIALAALPVAETPGSTRDGSGWALAGSVGAATWGAPMAIGTDYPPDFYVPSEVELRAAALRCGEAPRFEGRACTVAVAPTPLVCAERSDRTADRWPDVPLAHPLFTALDLAGDRARGVEILADWEPADITRVW